MPPSEMGGQGSRTPLSDYVRDYLAMTKVSKNQFAQGCVDPDDPRRVIYIQWLESLLLGRGPAPELWRLRALSVGMRADLEELKRMAAAQWLEYAVEETRTESEAILVAVPPGLSEESRRRIRRMAEAMAREEAKAET